MPVNKKRSFLCTKLALFQFCKVKKNLLPVDKRIYLSILFILSVNMARIRKKHWIFWINRNQNSGPPLRQSPINCACLNVTFKHIWERTNTLQGNFFSFQLNTGISATGQNLCWHQEISFLSPFMFSSYLLKLFLCQQLTLILQVAVKYISG